MGDLCVGCTEDTHQKMSENIQNFATRAKNVRRSLYQNVREIIGHLKRLFMTFLKMIFRTFLDVQRFIRVYEEGKFGNS